MSFFATNGDGEQPKTFSSQWGWPGSEERILYHCSGVADAEKTEILQDWLEARSRLWRILIENMKHNVQPVACQWFTKLFVKATALKCAIFF